MDPATVEALQRLGFSPGEAFILTGVLVQLAATLVRLRRVERVTADNTARLDVLAPKRATVAALN